jgi:hypothetical protein
MTATVHADSERHISHPIRATDRAPPSGIHRSDDASATWFGSRITRSALNVHRTEIT